MAEPDNCPFKDFTIPSQDEPHSSIVPTTIQANNFELPSLLKIVQYNHFSGNLTEDPNLHLPVFVQYADMLKTNSVNPEAIHLHLFPFSLRDRPRA